MSNNRALSVYEHVKDPLDFAMRFGTEIAKSRMFGCDNEAQGRVFALACLCEGENPISIARKNNIIDGNLTMKADAMLAEFMRIGGKHEIVSRTAELAKVKLTIGDETHTESLSWKEAQEEPFVWMSNGKDLKKNWRTPRARKQTLWARVISEAVRTLRPGINSGTYTPEEIDDFSDEKRQAKVVANHQPVDVEQFTKQVQQQQEAAQQPADVVDAEFETVNESTAEQRAQIRSLLDSLNADENAIAAILAKRNVQAIHQLSHEQASELVEALTNALAGQSRMPKDAHSTDVTGPADESMIDEIKSLLQDPSLVALVKEHLVKHGKQKIADLSLADARLLKNCLEMGSMESFFDKSLEGSYPADPT